MPQLPEEFGDLNIWGGKLNEFLRVSFNEDGTLKGSDSEGPVTGTALPPKVCGMYWPKYQGTLDLKSIDPQVNLVYLFQAGPLSADAPTYPAGSGAVALMGEGGDPGSFALESDAWWKDQVQTIRARGVTVVVSVGGAGAYVDLSSDEKRANLLASLIDIYDRIGGYDGLDFNLETTENGLDVYPANMVWVSQQLRKKYGNQFCFSIPAAQHVLAPFLQHDIDIVTALLTAGVLDFVAPQIYDGFEAMTESQKINLVNGVMNFWAPYVNNDWTKLGVGFRTVGDTTVAMAVPSAYTAFNVLAKNHPNIRGGFHFDAVSDAGQGWAWTHLLAPRIASGGGVIPVPPPIALYDDFTSATASATKWDFSGSAVVSGGVLSVDPTFYGDNANWAVSKSAFNMSGTTTQAKIGTYVTPGAPDNEGYTALWLIGTADANSYIHLNIYTNSSGLTQLEVRYRKNTADIEHQDFNLGYTPGVTKYFRFYVETGYLLMEDAPEVNGQPGDWTVRWLTSVDDLMPLTSAKATLVSSGAGTGGSWDTFGTLSTSTSIVGTAMKVPAMATGSRPTAASAGAGSMLYDITISKPVWSDGTTWRDASGTAV